MTELRDTDSRRNYKDRLSNVSGEFDLGLFLYILRKSIVWVVLCLVISAFVAFINLRYTPVVYQAKAVIQLAEQDNVNKILNVETVREEGQVEAKLEQLRSKLLISRTLQRLPLKVSYFAQGQILTSEHYSFSPYKVELLELMNPAIQDVPIFIQFTSPDQFSLVYNNRSYSGLRTNDRVETSEFKIIVTVEDSEQLMRNQDEYSLFFRINSLQSLTSRFYTNLDVRILNTTAKTIELSFRDNNPYLSRDFIRAHASEFIAFDLEKRQKSDDNVLAFLDSQIDTVFDRLRNSEISLNQYKQVNRITDLNDVGDVYLERLNTYEMQVASLQIEEKLLEQVEKLTRKNTTEIEVYNLIPLVAGSQHEETLSKLLDRLYLLLSDKQTALYSVTPESEKVRSINYQIDIQKNIILQSISALRDQLRTKKTDLQQKVRETETTYYQIPQKELEYARLVRLFTINEKYYTLLLEKAIEYRISKEGFVSNNQILEEARVPGGPISPNRHMVWFSFLLGGFILSFLIVVTRYFLHNNITSLNDVAKISDATLPSLGVIPRYKENIPVSMLIVDKNPRSLMAEAFRAIRTNLQFINHTPGPKVVAITSTISGEGKTFVALNMAGIIAFSGKKVVVCDLDMRKPKIHRGFDVENSDGMSTLLIGKSTIDKAIRHSKLENLDYITAGPIPPNPSELIISPEMDVILAQLKAIYDTVILDTPPAGLVTDAVTLLQKADYPVYIFRSDYSRKQFVQVADKLQNENHIPLSVVLNGVDLDRSKYSRKYSYGYGYGYGYTSGDGYYEGKAGHKKLSWFRRIFRGKS